MDRMKESEVVTQSIPVDPENANLPKEKRGTADDQRDMWRMGKAQELRRNFRFVSILGFTMLVMVSLLTRVFHCVFS